MNDSIPESISRINKIAVYSENGHVRCLHSNTVKAFTDAMNEVACTVGRLNQDGLDVEVKFMNQIDEITPCNSDRSLFYFRYIGRRVEK